MRYLLLCVGSRGDAEPFCALADTLLDRGHDVDIFLQPELIALAPPGANIHQWPFTQFDFYKFVANPSHGKDHENPRVRFVGIVTDCIAELVLPCVDQVLQVANNGTNCCDAVIASALARNLGFLLSDKLHKPSIVTHLQALVPTSLYPHYSNAKECVSALTSSSQSQSNLANLTSYVDLERYQYDFLQERLDKIYQKLGIQSLSFDQTMERLQGKHAMTGLANAFDSALSPHPTDAGPYVYDIGPLADGYIPKTFTPSDDNFQEFLTKERPICVGFGSMPYDRVSILLEALEEVDQKAILVGLSLPKDCTEWATANVRTVQSLPYAWLLPQCRMMLSHGGAGVVHATLQAGIPAVIAPLMGDQFFFADLLQTMNLGRRVGTATLTSFTKQDLVEAIRAVSTDCLETTKEWGVRTRAKERGVTILTKLLEDVVAHKTRGFTGISPT